MTAAPIAPHPHATTVVEFADEIDPDIYLETKNPSSTLQRIVVSLVVFGPVVGLIVAVIGLWGSGIKMVDVITGLFFYAISGLGITIGFHRMLTHRSFVAKRWLRISLAIAGSFAVQGSATSWVALHRRHHVYSDRIGDPHSPNLFGLTRSQMFRGFIHSHTGWLYTSEEANAERWAPDLVADKDIRIVSALTPVWMILTFALPALIGYIATGTVGGAFQCCLWAGVVRIFVLHHITWSTNSLCHMFGKHPFSSNDLSRNFAPFALLSFGESWHNGHHAFPSSARHGLEKGQLDISARIIFIFEKLHLVSNVRVPTAARIETRRLPA